MGTTIDGLYRPVDHEDGWGDEVNDNFSRLAELGRNVKGYLATGDGVTNDTGSFQDTHDDLDSSGSVLFAPPGTYIVQGFDWTTGNTVIQGAGRERTILKTASGDLLNIGTAGSNIANLTMRDLTLWSASGGGDVVVPQMGSTKILDRAIFERVSFRQDNNASRIFNWDGPGLVDVVFNACQFQHTAGGTVNPMYFRSSQGDMNAVSFINRCRATYSGEHFFYVESTAAASYAYDWHWEDFTGEVLAGGFLKGLGMFMPRLVKVGNYDMGTSTRDWVLLGQGSGGAKTRKFTIDQLIRASGTLGGGLNDIDLTASGEVVEGTIANCDTATVAGLTIDLASNHGILITNSPASTISNLATTTMQLSTPSSTRAIIRMGAAPTTWQVGSGTPEGSITANPGSLWSDITNGKLYVKEGAGTGNTGWVLK